MRQSIHDHSRYWIRQPTHPQQQQQLIRFQGSTLSADTKRDMDRHRAQGGQMERLTDRQTERQNQHPLLIADCFNTLAGPTTQPCPHPPPEMDKLTRRANSLPRSTLEPSFYGDSERPCPTDGQSILHGQGIYLFSLQSRNGTKALVEHFLAQRNICLSTSGDCFGTGFGSVSR